MSTLVAANIQNTGSGAPEFKNSSGTEIGQLTKAWVNFNGTGTVAIRDDFNVSSITDNATGEYTINFSTAMPNANYCAAGNGAQTTDSVAQFDSVVFINYGTQSIKVEAFGAPDSASTEYDLEIVCAAIFSN